MKSPKEVFEEYVARRKGIIRALTTDVEQFVQACDPNRENLCLYGFPDGTWHVDLPAEEVPPEIPEPALGINFARDGMQRRDWLALVAVHSDSWLLALAFYKGARLNKEQRDELFGMCNSLPTCYEVVSGKAAPVQKTPNPGSSTRPHKQRRVDDYEDDFDEDDDDDDWRDGDGDPCPSCRRRYRKDDFWIACDACDTWYCGDCAKMTEAKAQKMKTWRCPRCSARLS